MDIESESKYWHKEWANRMGPKGVRMNLEKFKVVINELWKHTLFIGLEKLEIGCGTGIHANQMSMLYPCWKTMWTGIDLAESAVKKAKEFGLNAEVASIYTYDTDKKFQVFLFLDSFEHLEDHKLVAKQIKKFAKEPYCIFGNVPMYTSTSHEVGAFERSVDIHMVAQFLQDAGCRYRFRHTIYGSYGYPYLLFEAHSGKNK